MGPMVKLNLVKNLVQTTALIFSSLEEYSLFAAAGLSVHLFYKIKRQGSLGVALR